MAKLELIQAANRAPVYAPSDNVDDAPQRRLVPLVPIRLLPLCVHSQVPSMYFLTGIQPSSMLTLGLKTPRHCSRIRLIRATVLPDFDGPRKMPEAGKPGGESVSALLYTAGR